MDKLKNASLEFVFRNAKFKVMDGFGNFEGITTRLEPEAENSTPMGHLFCKERLLLKDVVK